MNIQAYNKLMHYNLNLDYQITNLSLNNQTNLIINKIINDFIYKYQNDFNKKIFVYEFNDDLPSMVGYRILQAITAVKSDFTFKLYGKAKFTKKMIAKGQKYCSKRKLKKDNIIFISNFNSIYQVLKNEKKSNLLITPSVYLIEQMTVEEILTARVFYHIGYIKKDFTETDTFKETVYDNYLKWMEFIGNKIKIPYKDEIVAPAEINLIWIDNNEDDINNLQEVEQSDGLNFYYYNSTLEVPLILQDINFALAIKKTTNRPNINYLNLNFYELPSRIAVEFNLKFNYIGNWPEKNKNWIEDSYNKILMEAMHENYYS